MAEDKPMLPSDIPTEKTSEKEKSHFSTTSPGLFSDEEMVLDEILSSDPENLTPLQALQLVSRWKSSLSGR